MVTMSANSDEGDYGISIYEFQNNVELSVIQNFSNILSESNITFLIRNNYLIIYMRSMSDSYNFLGNFFFIYFFNLF